jgi:hypothetical protein
MTPALRRFEEISRGLHLAGIVQVGPPMIDIVFEVDPEFDPDPCSSPPCGKRAQWRLFTSTYPCLHTRAPVDRPSSELRDRRPFAETPPSVKRARVPPQFGGEFFRCQKF